MTYSIVARDPDTGLLGVASQSHFFAVGSIATFAEPGVGAVASQAFASRQYGPLGLDLLRAGVGAADVLAALVRLDPRAAIRQVGVVDATGAAAGFTGDGCVVHAGHVTGPGFSVQGNMLASAEVWPAMAEAYQAAGGDLVDRFPALHICLATLLGVRHGRVVRLVHNHDVPPPFEDFGPDTDVLRVVDGDDQAVEVEPRVRPRRDGALQALARFGADDLEVEIEEILHLLPPLLA